MGFRINTNVSAMNALVNATATNDAMSVSLQRLSSGLRINRAGDDAAGPATGDPALPVPPRLRPAMTPVASATR